MNKELTLNNGDGTVTFYTQSEPEGENHSDVFRQSIYGVPSVLLEKMEVAALSSDAAAWEVWHSR